MPGHRPIVDGLSHLPAIIPQQVGEVEVREVPGGLNPNLGNLPLLRAARVIPPTRQGVREVRPIRGVPRGLLWGTGVRGRRGR
jgi:hypothetical protein